MPSPQPEEDFEGGFRQVGHVRAQGPRQQGLGLRPSHRARGRRFWHAAAGEAGSCRAPCPRPPSALTSCPPPPPYPERQVPRLRGSRPAPRRAAAGRAQVQRPAAAAQIKHPVTPRPTVLVPLICSSPWPLLLPLLPTVAPPCLPGSLPVNLLLEKKEGETTARVRGLVCTLKLKQSSGTQGRASTAVRCRAEGRRKEVVLAAARLTAGG